MKRKLLLIVFALVFGASINGKAQITIPKGKALLMEFTNDSARFTVPQGKVWYVVNVFTAPGKVGSYIYLKSINDKNLSSSKFIETNLLLFGKSEQPPVNYPIVFPSETTFELILMDGFYNKSEKTAYLNVIEVNEE